MRLHSATVPGRTVPSRLLAHGTHGTDGRGSSPGGDCASLRARAGAHTRARQELPKAALVQGRKQSWLLPPARTMPAARGPGRSPPPSPLAVSAASGGANAGKERWKAVPKCHSSSIDHWHFGSRAASKVKAEHCQCPGTTPIASIATDSWGVLSRYCTPHLLPHFR